MLTTILTILASLVPTILANSNVIGTKSATLISNLLGPVATLFANLKSGSGSVQDGLAVLGAIQGVIAVLKSETNLPATVLTEITNVDADVQAALAKYVQAQGGYDASLYAQIAPVA